MFYTNPNIKDVRLIIFYRNFMHLNHCHIGLGVNALHTVKVLRQHRIQVDAFGVWTVADVDERLKLYPETTHCLIEAPWISTNDLIRLINKYRSVHFIMRIHSQVGFLQVEPGAINIIREQLVLQEGQLNFSVASNTSRLVSFIREAYRCECLYLPNLYNLDRVVRKPTDSNNSSVLRISSFGALRLLKNHTSAAAAALMIARNLNKDLEFWISVDREEHGKSVLQAIRNMMSGLPWATLVENKWQPWPEFRQTVSYMDLCLQVSMTETFNIVTADAVSEGVPSVVGPAIEWAPDAWKAEIDDAADIALKGTHVLTFKNSAHNGLEALQYYLNQSISAWIGYLGQTN